jgi:hypothetical protein
MSRGKSEYFQKNKQIAREHRITEKAGMKWEREPTDMMCCAVFIFFVIGMIGISFAGIASGKPSVIFTPFDSDGNMCGQPKQKMTEIGNNIPIRDFSDYKYKFFTNLDKFDLNKKEEAFKDPQIYRAVCVKKCPEDVTSETIGKGETIECMVNQDVPECPKHSLSIFMNTTERYNYCIPKTDKAEAIVKEMYKELDESVGGFGNYVNDIKIAWLVMLVMAIVSFLITIGYVYLLKYFTKPLLYTSLFLIFLLGCGTTIYAYSETENMPFKDTKEYHAAKAGTTVIACIVVLYTCFILCNWSSISLGASIMETASEFVVENKSIIYQPFIGYAVCLPIIIWWTISAVFIYSMGTPIFEENTFVATIEGSTKSNYMFIYFVFGLFWVLSWIIAMQNFSTIATTCMWYFTGEGSDAVQYRQVYSSTMAIKWAFQYHAGSMAMGSFLVAVVTIIRLVFEYIIYQYEKATPGENTIWKIVKAIIRFVSWSLDCCVKYVNKNAYIQIALRNEAFCPAAKTSFYLAVRNAARASAVGIISGILAVLGKGFIVAASSFLTISLVNSTQP